MREDFEAIVHPPPVETHEDLRARYSKEFAGESWCQEQDSRFLFRWMMQELFDFPDTDWRDDGRLSGPLDSDSIRHDFK